MRPYRVLLFIVACLGVLALLCAVLPHRVQLGSRTLRWPTLAEVLELSDKAENSEYSEYSEDSEISEYSDVFQLEEFPVAPDSLIAEADMEAAATSSLPPAPPVAVDSLIDTRVWLASFYDALAHSGEHVVRVMHYGDSQIEEDRMTSQIREKLQDRYGGRGVGLLPLAQTIPSRSVRQELYMSGRRVSPAQGPRRYMVYALRRDQRDDGRYGPMGQVAWMADSLVGGSEEIMAVCKPLDGRPRYTHWQVLADDSVHYSCSGDTVRLKGRGAVYGLSQESRTGVIVDNIPMRGCLGLVFTKMDTDQLYRFYSDNHVALIIMQFGGNAIPFNRNPGTIAAIVRGLREQVRYLKACAPYASILFVGPSDMLTTEDGEQVSYPMVPYMDRLLRKMAIEEEIAYFSLYNWMGGYGSMAHWQEIGLAGSDGVHFYRSGARKAGNAVADWILEGVNE